MTASKPRKGLLWIGDGTRFIPGVPARDLTPAEVGSRRSDLVGSGLYIDAAPAKPAADESPSADGKET
jgi:hypothetical protein